MKRIDLNKPLPDKTGQAPTKKSSVVISPNIIHTRVRVDMWGNEIDPRTKQIIKKAEQ